MQIICGKPNTWGKVAIGEGGILKFFHMTANSEVLCGCGVSAREGKKAVEVDPAIKERNLKRLRRIEGQVRGLQKMVDEDRYCADIMMQVSSVQEALRSVGRELMRNHLKHCAATAIRKGGDEADQMYDELLDLVYRSGR